MKLKREGIIRRPAANIYEQHTLMEEVVPIDSREDNQLLLNAIKNKFAAHNACEAAAAAASFSPPKFTIPILRTPRNEEVTSRRPVDRFGCSAEAATQLNDFLLSQLQQKCTNGEIASDPCNGFMLPQLRFGNKAASGSGNDGKHELSFQRTSVSSLSRDIKNLKVKDDDVADDSECCPSSPAIDLTAALTSGTTQSVEGPSQPNCSLNTAPSPDDEDDDEYHDDDEESTTLQLDSIADEYCQIDISQLVLCHSCVQPSPIGRVLGLHYKRSYPVAPSFLPPTPIKTKHKIVPFRFDTKSPDDKVQAAMSKYQRQHYN